MPLLDSQALLGQLACLGAALLWAIALTIFRRPIELYGARRVNLAKCSLAATFQGYPFTGKSLPFSLYDKLCFNIYLETNKNHFYTFIQKKKIPIRLRLMFLKFQFSISRPLSYKKCIYFSNQTRCMIRCIDAKSIGPERGFLKE